MPVVGDGWRRGQGTSVAWQPMPSILRQRLTLLLTSAQLIEVQAEYHRKSLTLLQAVLPQIKAQQGECQAGLGQGGRGACRPPPCAWSTCSSPAGPPAREPWAAACRHLDQWQESGAHTHTHYPSEVETGVHGHVWRCVCNRKPSSSAYSGVASTASPSSSPSSPETAGMAMLQLDSASMDIVGQCFSGQCFHVHCSVSLGHLGEAV